MATLDTFDAYLQYDAISLHFKSKSYDYFKYHGKTRKNWDTFIKVRNKGIFTKLARKYTDKYPQFIATSFGIAGEPITWAGDLIHTDKFHDVWMNHEKFLQSSKVFKDEFYGILQVMDNNSITLNQALINTNKNDIPVVEKLRIQGLISYETMIVIDNIFKFSDRVETNNPVWTETKSKLDKYTPFMKMDMTKYKDIVRNSSLLNRIMIAGATNTSIYS